MEGQDKPLADHLTGVVLCGGASQRMGEDKGLIRYFDKPWAQWMAELLLNFNIPVVLSVNVSQKEQYEKELPGYQLIEDERSGAWKGPLKGLISVHKQIPEKDLMVLPCDLLHMKKDVLARLVKNYTEDTNKEYSFFAFHTNNYWEPLCAIYRKEGLQELEDSQTKGKLSTYRLQKLLTNKSTWPVIVQKHEKPFFQNLNHPEDIKNKDK